MAILYNYSAYVVSTVWCYSNFITFIIIINAFKYPLGNRKDFCPVKNCASAIPKGSPAQPF